MKGILCIFGFHKNDNLEKLKRGVYEIRNDTQVTTRAGRE